MSHSGIRDLSPEERALVSGGAQMDTTDLPPVDAEPPTPDPTDLPPIDATPPPDDNWFPEPPTWPDPWDPGDGDGGGGGGGNGDGGGGGSDGGDGSPDITFIDVKTFESKLTYTPGENGEAGYNKAVMSYPIASEFGQWTVSTELKFNSDGSFKDGKGELNFLGTDGSQLKWTLEENGWTSTINGGYYWDIGGGFGFQVNVIYNSASNDVSGQAQFMFNKSP